MEFCERDYTQMRITPLTVTLTISLPPCFHAETGNRGVDCWSSTLSQPLRVSARVWDRCRASRPRIMVDEGEQWIENCFMLRFLIRPGLGGSIL